ncbi:MAG: hypothetical protein RBG13Loki_0307 [Promethearchaeota archaeon CR_4]|nr:MAG: hypothetical protein RBG13Loki_0307 [Candidatus Lokiarchaeota archaeon CR_4]
MTVLDFKAGELATTLEMDTTWKGRSHKFFANKKKISYLQLLGKMDDV